ncbi:MAG: hypothetical protein RBS34_03710, partial [Desulfofustis sp.]|nr:hypothetical protein [Desulfofustis sp.]
HLIVPCGLRYRLRLPLYGELEKFEISFKIEARKVILSTFHVHDIPVIRCDCAPVRWGEMALFHGSLTLFQQRATQR